MRVFSVTLLITFAILGCQPAARYSSGEQKKVAAPAPLASSPERGPSESELQWRDDKESGLVPIQFVQFEKNPDEWKSLPKYWNLLNRPERTATPGPAMAFGLPLAAPRPVAPDPQIVKIKVPLGLDDPTPYLPATNPLTREKWELGRQLFFDSTWLSGAGKVSCASCHFPEKNFTDGLKAHKGFNTPTLVNVVYNRAFFWDGRARTLEETFARTLDDERAPADVAEFHHAWGGSIQRLARNERLGRHIERIFGTPPTQDNVGKALATYLRALLAANSVHDRALQIQKDRRGNELTAADYEKVLTGGAITSKAADIAYGYRLFNDLVPERRLNCTACHGGSQYTDGQFHNAGVGAQTEGGRITSVPFGQKEPRLVGAYKTPTLRGLGRTAPYFHNGWEATLADAIAFHTQRYPWNPYLAPELVEAVPSGFSKPRHLNLTEPEMRALLAFLEALNGELVDAALLPQQKP